MTVIKQVYIQCDGVGCINNTADTFSETVKESREVAERMGYHRIRRLMYERNERKDYCPTCAKAINYL